MQVEHRAGRSLSTRALHAGIRPFGSRLVKPGKPLPAGSPRLTIPASAKKHCNVTERQVQGIWLYDFEQRSNDSIGGRSQRRIYYFAGGGFQNPPSSQHWSLVAELATATPAIVTVVSYPLAPNSPAKESIPHLARAYDELMRESAAANEIVTFMGDSAGGNVALCLVLYALQNSPETHAPFSIFVMSPCADCRNDNPEMKLVDKMDPLLDSQYTDEVAATWTSGTSRTDPMVSPVLADLSLLESRGVRLDGIVGTWDVLAPDALPLLEKAKAANLKGMWLVWDQQMHCWPLTWKYGLSDGKAGKDWIVKTLKISL